VKEIDLYGDGIGKVEYIRHMGTDATIVQSARVSFYHDMDSEELTTKDKKLIKFLIRNKHTSTFEHCQVTFRCTVPLFVRSQHHRHRTWKFNEVSRRYTDFNIQFYEPTSFRTQSKNNKQASNLDEVNPLIGCEFPDLFGMANRRATELVKEHHRRSLELFDSLLEAGVCREQARGLLPQNMYTRYYATIDLNNLLKFIDLRLHPHAQWEIQRVAEAFLKIAGDLWPVAVEEFRNRSEV